MDSMKWKLFAEVASCVRPDAGKLHHNATFLLSQTMHFLYELIWLIMLCATQEGAYFTSKNCTHLTIGGGWIFSIDTSIRSWQWDIVVRFAAQNISLNPFNFFSKLSLHAISFQRIEFTSDLFEFRSLKRHVLSMLGLTWNAVLRLRIIIINIFIIVMNNIIIIMTVNMIIATMNNDQRDKHFSYDSKLQRWHCQGRSIFVSVIQNLSPSSNL